MSASERKRKGKSNANANVLLLTRSWRSKEIGKRTRGEGRKQTRKHRFGPKRATLVYFQEYRLLIFRVVNKDVRGAPDSDRWYIFYIYVLADSFLTILLFLIKLCLLIYSYINANRVSLNNSFATLSLFSRKFATQFYHFKVESNRMMSNIMRLFDAYSMRWLSYIKIEIYNVFPSNNLQSNRIVLSPSICTIPNITWSILVSAQPRY